MGPRAKRPLACQPKADRPRISPNRGPSPPRSSNSHLQRAIALYGLPSFIFIVVELCSPPDTLAREQYWLNWLFSLPKCLRYNFLAHAGSTQGYKHSLDTKARMSSSHLGLANASKAASVYSLDNQLVNTFSSQTAAAKWLGVSNQMVTNAIKRGHIVKGMYRVVVQQK